MIFITAAKIIFWLNAGIIVYVYAGYPLLVFLVGRFFPKRIRKGDIEPRVSFVITAYNEELAIREKIENTLAIIYPRENLEIIVASDGSTDKTDEIVKEFSRAGVRLFRQEGRVGKTQTQNKAVEQAATGEIILFSDATSMCESGILSEILPNFADPAVGCVAGRLTYINDSNSAIGEGTLSYWSYEKFLKENESQASSLIGVSGCLYAVRRSAYQPMYPEACSDFVICSVIYRQGLRSIYEPKAVCTEVTNNRPAEEFKMRVRIITQTFADLWQNRDMLNPFKSGIFALQMISHKLLRYAVPAFLILSLLSSFIAGIYSNPFTWIFGMQMAFYSLAFGAYLMERNGRNLGVLAIPLYFVHANVASIVGFYRFLSGERFRTWEPIRQI